MDRHGKHRDNVYCAFESWLGGSWEGKGDYTPRVYNGKILSNGIRLDLFSGLEERLEIELVRNLRLEIETISVSLIIFRSPVSLLGELFFFLFRRRDGEDCFLVLFPRVWKAIISRERD